MEETKVTSNGEAEPLLHKGCLREEHSSFRSQRSGQDKWQVHTPMG